MMIISFQEKSYYSFLNDFQRGVARRGASVPWTNGIVPYEISSNFG